MRGKIVNVCASIMNILFVVLILIYMLYIPQDIIDLTVQELSVTKTLLKANYIILAIVVIIDILQYNNHRDNSRIKTGY